MIDVAIDKKILLTVEEASSLSNIGINKLYKMTNNPRCTFVLYSGKKRLIKRKSFEEFLEKSIEII